MMIIFRNIRQLSDFIISSAGVHERGSFFGIFRNLKSALVKVASNPLKFVFKKFDTYLIFLKEILKITNKISCTHWEKLFYLIFIIATEYFKVSFKIIYQKKCVLKQ